MPGVAAVLLDEVAQELAQTGVVTVRRRRVDELIDSAIGQGSVKPRTGPSDGPVPENFPLP